jgi:hypothetical protein
VLALASNKEEQTLKKATLQNYFKEQADVVGTLSEDTQVYRLSVLETLMACTQDSKVEQALTVSSCKGRHPTSPAIRHDPCLCQAFSSLKLKGKTRCASLMGQREWLKCTQSCSDGWMNTLTSSASKLR